MGFCLTFHYIFSICPLWFLFLDQGFCDSGPFSLEIPALCPEAIGFSKVSGWFPRPKRIQYFHQFNLLLHLTWGWQSWKLRFILCSSYCVSVDFPGNGPAAALSSVPAGGCVMRYGQMSRRERLVYYSSITAHIHF